MVLLEIPLLTGNMVFMRAVGDDDRMKVSRPTGIYVSMGRRVSRRCSIDNSLDVRSI